MVMKAADSLWWAVRVGMPLPDLVTVRSRWRGFARAVVPAVAGVVGVGNGVPGRTEVFYHARSPGAPLLSHLDASASASASAVGDPGHLLQAFAQVRDPRSARGVRWPVATVPALMAAATAAGCVLLDDVTAWIAEAPREVLIACGCRRDAFGLAVAPHPKTVTRLVERLDAQEAADVAGRVLARGSDLPSAAYPIDGPVPQVALAADGKAVRGAAGADGMVPYLLALATHAAGEVVGEVAIGPKTNEVRHEALCCIPDAVRRNSEECSWARWLPETSSEFLPAAPGIQRSASRRTLGFRQFSFRHITRAPRYYIPRSSVRRAAPHADRPETREVPSDPVDK